VLFRSLVANGNLGGANLTINGQDYDDKKFTPQSNEKKIFISKNENRTLLFLYKANDNSSVIKQFSFSGGSYKIGFSVLSGALDGKSIVVGWKAGIAESEGKGQNIKSASGVSEPRKVHVLDINNNVTHFQFKKVEKEEESGFYKWSAITSKYFMVALVADTARNTDLLIESFEPSEIDKKAGSSLNYEIQMRRSGEGTKEGFWIYAGPTKYKLIKSYKEHFSKVLFGGWSWLLGADVWFPFICEITLWLLISINGVIKDYGITILLVTLLVRIITYPLSQTSMKSMSRMKDLQPKINHLRERYKTNPRKMNEEIMALYKQEGVNPFNPGGCLPMLLQMPILFALFVVLRKAIELRGAQTVLIPWVKDLSQPECLISLSNILPNGIPMYGNSIALLPIIMAILTFFQNKMTIKDPNQKMMIYFMPVFMLVLFNNFPAGLVLYWTFSNALGILQQVILEKSLKTQTIAIKQTKPAGRKR
jgi:YidC/Oxa1 family membrane protein insertase